MILNLKAWPALSQKIGAVASLAGLLALGGGLIWHFALLEARVANLEDQMLVLTASPTLTVETADGAEIIANPIREVCADLARTHAQMTDAVSFIEAGRIENLMERLNCFATDGSASR